MEALVLVGHGSQLSADSSAPVYGHARTIRVRGIFDEVRVGFWKEEPSLRQVLDMVASDDVFVVPIFVADGYFTRRVVPRELGLDGPVTSWNGRLVRYCDPIGTHPGIARLILRRAADTARISEHEQAATALVVIGHGTELSDTSGDVVYENVRRLRESAPYATVTAGFLDQEPRIEDVVEKLEDRHIVLVPFLIAEGWHTRETIPRDLGLSGARTQRGGRTIWYTPPIGTFPGIADIAIERAIEAGARSPGPVDA